MEKKSAKKDFRTFVKKFHKQIRNFPDQGRQTYYEDSVRYDLRYLEPRLYGMFEVLNRGMRQKYKVRISNKRDVQRKFDRHIRPVLERNLIGGRTMCILSTITQPSNIIYNTVLLYDRGNYYEYTGRLVIFGDMYINKLSLRSWCDYMKTSFDDDDYENPAQTSVLVRIIAFNRKDFLTALDEPRYGIDYDDEDSDTPSYEYISPKLQLMDSSGSREEAFDPFASDDE